MRTRSVWRSKQDPPPSRTRSRRFAAAAFIAVLLAGLPGCDAVSEFLGLGGGDDQPDDKPVTPNVTFTVTFDGNGGTWQTDEDPVSVVEVTTKNGGTVTLPGNPSSDDPLTFCAGWNTQKNGSGDDVNGSTVVTGDITVYARWGSPGEGWQDTDGVVSKNFPFPDQQGDGNIQTFTVLLGGRYRFELWGAQGGRYSTNSRAPGGYSAGSLELAGGDTLYLYAGGRGADATGQAGADGGWNGGGNGGSALAGFKGGHGGGGATDVRLAQGQLNTRIIVAGGAGGHSGTDLQSKFKSGGAGGGVTGIAGGNLAGGGSQTEGNTFGIGQAGGDGADGSSMKEGHGGGGGGYWGGNALPHGQNISIGGGGGSGFVYGYDQTPGVSADDANWIPPEYQGYKFTGDFACIAGDADAGDYPANPDTSGNGYIRITYLP